ncbi:hypothetical protein BJX62DRAFT_242394 [Aspergillus germanicus]
MAKSKRPHSEAFTFTSSTSQDNAPAGQESATAPATTSNAENAFKNCVVAICGHHEPYKTAVLKEMISRLGAQNSRIVKRITTHLVTTETEVNFNAKQVTRARGNPTCSIVSLQWLLDSEKAGTPLPVELYRLDTLTPTPAQPKEEANDTATSASEQQDTGNAIEAPGMDQHLFTFQVNVPQPGSGAQNVEEHGDVDTPERPAKKRRIRQADHQGENEDQAHTVADDTVAVFEEQPATATTLPQSYILATTRQTPGETPHNADAANVNLGSTYDQQQVFDHGFHQAVYPAMYNSPPTALNIMPAAETHTQAHVQQPADSQHFAETAHYHEEVSNNPEHGFQQGMQEGPYHNHNPPATANATHMVSITTAQDLICNGQYPANFPAPEPQPESRWARDRQLPIPSYARSTGNEFNAFRGEDYSTQDLEPERPRAGGQQILYYNPTAGEPIHMPGYVDPEYAHALTWRSGNGNQ